MGEVWRAWDDRLERAVAIKKVRAREGRREKDRERLRREARAIASLNHPAIVRIFDLLETGDGDWIVMELVEGRTLRQLLDHRVIVETEALALAREVTEGLAAAHGQGLVHRDLKSENVMVTHRGHVKLLDFGLAQSFVEQQGGGGSPLGRSPLGRTPLSRVAGTGRAMSPEQARGLPLDPRSDLFSLGSLLYEMVTGESPFQGPSTYVTMTRVCYHRQPPAREARPEVSPELSNFIDHLLEKVPERRPESAEHVGAVLKSLAGIAPLPPSLVHLVWPADSAVSDGALSDSTAGVPRFLPKTLLAGGGTHSSIFVWTVLATDLVNATDLLRRCGDQRAAGVFLRHDRFVRELLPRFSGREIDKSDGFALLFPRPVDAVRFALTYHRRLGLLSREAGVELHARTGIHMGELYLRENPPEDVARGAKPYEAEGPTRLIASRVVQRAGAGRILITRGAYEMARPARLDLEAPAARIAWRALGEVDLPGLGELEVYEIALEGGAAAEPSAASLTESTAELPPVRRPPVRRPPVRRRLAGAALAAAAALVVAVLLALGPCALQNPMG